MPEEFDFSELRKYLQGQMDMGEEDLLLDEPWTLTRKKAVPAGVRPANPMPQMQPRSSNPAPFPQRSAPANPAPFPAQSNAPANPAPFPANPAPFANPTQPAFQQSAFGAPAQTAPSPRPAPAPKLDAGLTIAPRTNSLILSTPFTMRSRPMRFTHVPQTLFVTKARNTHVS